MNDHLEENRYQENGKKINNLGKVKKLDKNEIYKNKPNEYYEEIKSGKKLKLNQNNIYSNKCKLRRNDFIDDFIEDKNILENMKIKRNEEKYKIKFNIIYIIIQNLIKK